MTVIRKAAVVLVGAALAASAALVGATQSDAVRAAVPRPIGAPGPAFAGPPVTAAELRRLLRAGPTTPSNVSPEFGEPGEEGEGDSAHREPAARSIAAAQTPRAVSTPISPAPSVSWQAMTGQPNCPPGQPLVAATGQGTPPDPQIAVSSTFVVVGVGTGLLLYKKDGTPYPSACNYVDETKLFQPLIDAAQLAKDANGHIDNFNDLRVIFDPYRKRFWTVATGAYRTCIPDPQDPSGPCVKGATTLPADEERMVVGLAVSADEDPTHGWYLYYWDAAVGWKKHSPPYQPRDMGDYPSIGINATTVDVSVSVSSATRSYPHIALYNADDMAADQGPTVQGWHLYPLINADGTACASGGLQNPDGSCPGSIVQPTLAHPDPGGSYLVSVEGASKLVIWKVTDLLQPTQQVTSAEVPLPTPLVDPANSVQKDGKPTNLIAFNNLHNWPLKVVWRWFLYVTLDDAGSTKLARVRVLRLWVSDFPNVPAPPASGSNGGSRQLEIGAGSTGSFGWPALEVNKNNDSVVVYAIVGPNAYASIRYNAWIFDEATMRGGRLLKAGEATETQLTDSNNNPLLDKYGNLVPTRWGDLAGASVDFAFGKEADGIWIVHEYARSTDGVSTSNGSYGIWVGKIFG